MLLNALALPAVQPMDLASIPLDSTEAFESLACEFSLPANLLDHLKACGFTTVALVGHALVGEQDVQDFIDSLKLDAVNIEAPKFSPARSTLQRLICKCIQRAKWSGPVAQQQNAPRPNKFNIQKHWIALFKYFSFGIFWKALLKTHFSSFKNFLFSSSWHSFVFANCLSPTWLDVHCTLAGK